MKMLYKTSVPLALSFKGRGVIVLSFLLQLDGVTGLLGVLNFIIYKILNHLCV